MSNINHYKIMKKLTSKLPWFTNTWDHLRKLIMIMKLSVFIIIAASLNLFSAESLSQAVKLSVDAEKSTVLQVLNSIEQQSGLFFLYSTKLVDVEREVSLDYKDTPLNDVLAGLFEGTSVDFLIMDNQIVLSNKELLGKPIDTEAAQPARTVTGTVKDVNGDPLPGVNITIAGTTPGTITDNDGNYSISGVSNESTLVFSFVGLIT